MTTTIAPKEAFDLYQNGIPIVDVRTPKEFRSCHIDNAINIPLDEISKEIIESKFGNKNILIVCQAGVRGEKACQKLNKQGFNNCINISGGTNSWISQNLPTTKDTNCCAISVDRQVRIAAGSLVALGVIFSYLLDNPMWQLLSLFVGLGLVFAGVTNTCGLAAVLSKMPWNK